MPHATDLVHALGVAASRVVRLPQPGHFAPTSPDTPGPRSSFGRFTDADGRTGRFHVYARHIDPSRPVGVVFYLDGDYWIPATSRFHRPLGPTMLRLAAVANARNLVLVAADTPDRGRVLGGYTWWRRAGHNGRWFRAFAAHVVRRLRLDPERAWVMGYSGGAEFLTVDLLAHDQPDWLRGGAIMVGGGTFRDMTTPPSPALLDLPLTWWVGEKDGTGRSPFWSAHDAAEKGFAGFGKAGFRRRTLHEVPGTTHSQYDLPRILRHTLDGQGERG